MSAFAQISPPQSSSRSSTMRCVVCSRCSASLDLSCGCSDALGAGPNGLFFALIGPLLCTTPASDAQQGTDPLLDCLCGCACSELGFACEAEQVDCFHFPFVLTASPACSDVERGECVCRGFGCDRTPLVFAGTCPEGCLTSSGTAAPTSAPTPEPTPTIPVIPLENSFGAATRIATS